MIAHSYSAIRRFQTRRGDVMRYMVMPFRRCLDFRGRSRRREYWMFIVLQWILLAPLIAVFWVAGGDFQRAFAAPFSPQPGGAGVVMGIGWAVFAALLIPWLGVSIRRLHDRNISGWMLLTSFLPYLGTLILFVLSVLDGTPGANRFGLDPKGREHYDPGREPRRPPLG